MFVSVYAQAGTIYKCTEPDGSVTFSNIACPDDTVKREHKVRTGDAFQERSDFYNPYSVVEQARRIDELRQAEQIQREEAAAQRRFQEATEKARQAAGTSGSGPVLSYKEALRKATKDAGYRNYRNLTASQKETVRRKMAQYNHAPKPPRRAGMQPPQDKQLLINGVPAINTGGGNYIDARTGNFLQGAAGGVIDTKTGKFIPVH